MPLDKPKAFSTNKTNLKNKKNKSNFSKYFNVVSLEFIT